MEIIFNFKVYNSFCDGSPFEERVLIKVLLSYYSIRRSFKCIETEKKKSLGTHMQSQYPVHQQEDHTQVANAPPIVLLVNEFSSHSDVSFRCHMSCPITEHLGVRLVRWPTK